MKFSCEIYKKYPNESIDGFLVSIFDYEKKHNTNDILIKIIGTPFLCPSKEFYEPGYGKRPSLEDYVEMHDYLNGRALERWYEKNSTSSIASRTKKALNKIVFPKYNYQEAFEKIDGSENPRELLLLALLKHIYDIDKNIDDIVKILFKIKNKIPHRETDFTPEAPYDGSDESMIKYLRHYSMSLDGGRFVVPCGVLIARPSLLSVISSYYGDRRANSLPDHDCKQNNYPLPRSVYDYLKIVDVPQSDWLDRHDGSSRHMQYKRLSNQNLMIRVFPRQLLGMKKKRSHKYPYEAWSYLNIGNRNIFEKLKIAYLTAKKDMKHHYVTLFSLTDIEAKEAAESALWVTVREAHWGAPPISGLRYKILNGYPYEEIYGDINAIDDLADLDHSTISMDYYSGPWSYIGPPDPLIMVSVKRPDVLKLLIDKKNSKRSRSFRESLSYSNSGTEINAKNRIGKTALHAAIQQNEIESTKLLVEAGADLTAIVDGSLVHNKRTVAMYAAANANIELIQYLESNGVEFSARDSKGVGSIGYLMGFSVLDENPHLTKENYKQFIDLLNPDLFSLSKNKISPTYNCKKASNYAENLACSDIYIAMLDRVMSIHYKKISVNSEDKREVKESQVKWIRKKNKCKDSLCVKAAYQNRIEVISNYGS